METAQSPRRILVAIKRVVDYNVRIRVKPDGSGVVLFMPAYVPPSATAPAATGAKVVSVFGGNRNLGLRRRFMARVDAAPIRATSILNGAFADEQEAIDLDLYNLFLALQYSTYTTEQKNSPHYLTIR